jgi:CheY-like chemotaxis protein
MAKIMLVEDDNNLREIYEARLLAEGYEIVAAKDGEEALALAVKEKPDLIISDVMMPKISGFDMLDILRSTAETKNTKVIMMTALSQAEDKSRADKLGADRYLVKSQVTLEDVAKVAHDVLAGVGAAGAAPVALAETPADTPPAAPVAAPTTIDEPTTVTAAPVDPVADTPAVTVTTPPVMTTDPVTSEPAAPADEPVVTPQTPEPTSEPEVAPAPEASVPEVTVPTEEPTQPEEPAPTTTSTEDPTPEITETPAPTEEVKPAIALGSTGDLSQTTAEEEKAVESQINAIFAQPPTAEETDPAVVATPPPTMPGESPAVPAPEEPSESPAETTLPEAPVETVEVAQAPPTENVITPTEATPQPLMTDIMPPPEAGPDQSNGSVPIANKRVIQPISDISNKAPSLNELLQKEQDSPAVPATPATSVVSPGGQTVIPVTTDAPIEPSQPGNVVAPGDIAL